MSASEKPRPTVRVIDLTFAHPGETTEILRGVNLELMPREMLALTGPSGAGKTTLLNLIAGLITPKSGKVVVVGRDITRLTAFERARLRGQVIGYAYQDARLLPQLDVVTNVAWPLLFGSLSRKRALSQAQALLERLRLGAWAHHEPLTLSGGEQRRVALARALVAHPPLLLVDEPTANLDSVAANEVMDLLVQAQREFDTSILLISHSPEALERCQRVTELREGGVHEIQTQAVVP